MGCSHDYLNEFFFGQTIEPASNRGFRDPEFLGNHGVGHSSVFLKQLNNFAIRLVYFLLSSMNDSFANSTGLDLFDSQHLYRLS